MLSMISPKLLRCKNSEASFQSVTQVVNSDTNYSLDCFSMTYIAASMHPNDRYVLEILVFNIDMGIFLNVT